jgi:GNAT superfamily N-acetyltransferase
MDVQQIRQRLDDERRRLSYPGETLEVLPHLSRLASADGQQHSVIWSSLPPDQADRLIDEEIEHFRTIGKSVEWKVYRHDLPADLRERLTARGFRVGPLEAVLVLDLSAPPDWIDQTDTAGVLRIDRIEDLPLFTNTAATVFGKDYSFTTRELAAAIAAGRTDHRGYVAMCEQMPVSVGRLYKHTQSEFGGLYGGGTLASHRGRGFYRKLIAARARDARTMGAKYLIVDALPTSRPILERLGFVHVSDTWPCVMDPDGGHDAP